jgi:dihydroneopterin aldolase
MTDETSIAFERPEVRAEATQSGDPLDRISVRDFTKEVEIGAFQSERGTMQRIRFNIVLEVGRSTGAQTDDVDLILSYDTITEAVEEQLATERLNLLETLAERIAERILEHPSAVRIFVRIEKLDRIPGTLGIEIVRSKSSGQKADAGVHVNPLVVFLPNAVLHGNDLGLWLDAVAAHALPAIICLEPALEASPATGIAPVDKRIGLLSIEQNGWVLAAKDDRCVVVDSRTEIDWAMKNGQLSVWAPSKVVLDAVNKPDAGPDAPLALAQWFAKEFSADHVSVLGEYAKAVDSERLMLVATPSAL